MSTNHNMHRNTKVKLALSVVQAAIYVATFGLVIYSSQCVKYVGPLLIALASIAILTLPPRAFPGSLYFVAALCALLCAVVAPVASAAVACSCDEGDICTFSLFAAPLIHLPIIFMRAFIIIGEYNARYPVRVEMN